MTKTSAAKLHSSMTSDSTRTPTAPSEGVETAVTTSTNQQPPFQSSIKSSSGGRIAVKSSSGGRVETFMTKTSEIVMKPSMKSSSGEGLR